MSKNPFKYIFPTRRKSTDFSTLTTETDGISVYFRVKRRLRWWNLITLIVFILISREILNIFSLYHLLDKDYSPIRIAKRQYPFKSYTHLDTNVQDPIEKGTRVYHVTREFGPATLTEIGRTVTALAAAQQASNLTEVAVVMPYYSFLRKYITDKEIDMAIDIRGKKLSQTMTVEFRVWKMMHAFNPPVQAPSVYEWQMINNVNTSVLITPQRPAAPTDIIPVYMIGPANRRPFNQAFKCKTVQEINIENDLPLEWKDQYFAKATAAFIAHKATAADEESIFAPIRIVPRVDIVHIHGASNAYVTKFLQDKKEADDLGPRPPAIIYSIYDQVKEVYYTNTYKNIRKFLERQAERLELYKYIYDGKMYMSKFISDRADAIIYTNRTLAADLIEGRHDFHLKELVMDNLLLKAQNSRLYGINHGIDFHTTEHPFITDKLANRSMIYPQYAFNLIKDQPHIFSTQASRPFALEPLEDPAYWTLSEDPRDFVSLYKDLAKNYLVQRKLLTLDDLTRPVILFRGDLAKNSGVDIFINSATVFFEKYNIRWIIMGNRKNFPFDKLEALQKTYPDRLTLVTTDKQQRQLGVFIRAAADFVFDPNSKKNHDDRVIAQGMLFGAAAISTGTGKLQHALLNRPSHKISRRISIAYLDPNVVSEKGAVVTSYEYYNSYLFNNGKGTIDAALRDATKDFGKHVQNKALREEFILRNIRSAINLGWDRSHFRGPVHEYNQVYQLALEDRFIPEMKRHEVEQEHELVSRLQ